MATMSKYSTVSSVKTNGVQRVNGGGGGAGGGQGHPLSLQEAIRASTLGWQTDLEELFRNSKERFPDVVWELRGEEDDAGMPVGASAGEVWGHKAIIYARAPPSFQSRYFAFPGRPAISPSVSPGPYPDGGGTGTPQNYLDVSVSNVSLSLRNLDDFGTGALGLLRSRSPSPQRQHSSPRSRGGSPAPSTCTTAIAVKDGVLRLATSINPALFSNELEYLYTASGFSDAFEFLFDQAPSLLSSTSTSNAGDQRQIVSTPRTSLNLEQLASMGEFGFGNGAQDEKSARQARVDKLRKDLVYMWRSRLYSDVKIALTGEFSSMNHETSTAIFSSHRFILVSRCEYFRTALKDWPTNEGKRLLGGSGNGSGKKRGSGGGGDEDDEDGPEIVTLTLPSPPFTPASLHFTLGYIYTGTLVFSHRTYDLSTALSLLRSATYLGLDALYDEIQARIIQEMMHGLGHAFLSFESFEMIGGTQHPPPLCRCKPCLRRAPRILEFAMEPDVKNVYLERGARRVLVGGFGEGWGTQEFASLPSGIHTSLLKSLRKRTTSHTGSDSSGLGEGEEGRWRPGNVFAILWSAEEGLRRLMSLSSSGGNRGKGAQEWIETVRELVLKGRAGCDEVLGNESWACFHIPVREETRRASMSPQDAFAGGYGKGGGGEHVNYPPSHRMHHAHKRSVSRNLSGDGEGEMGDWEQLMHSDGARFEDREKVEWVLASVRRGLSESGAGRVYETLVSQILLHPDPQHTDRALLGQNSMIRGMVEELRVDVLRYIRKKWVNMVNLGAFDELEAWSLKEISDNIEVPIDDLLSGNVPPSGHGEQKGGARGLSVKGRKPTGDQETESSMRVSVLSRNLPRTPSVTTSSSSIGSEIGRGERPDSKLTPPSLMDGESRSMSEFSNDGDEGDAGSGRKTPTSPPSAGRKTPTSPSTGRKTPTPTQRPASAASTSSPSHRRMGAISPGPSPSARAREKAREERGNAVRRPSSAASTGTVSTVRSMVGGPARRAGGSTTSLASSGVGGTATEYKTASAGDGAGRLSVATTRTRRSSVASSTRSSINAAGAPGPGSPTVERRMRRPSTASTATNATSSSVGVRRPSSAASTRSVVSSVATPGPGPGAGGSPAANARKAAAAALGGPTAVTRKVGAGGRPTTPTASASKGKGVERRASDAAETKKPEPAPSPKPSTVSATTSPSLKSKKSAGSLAPSVKDKEKDEGPGQTSSSITVRPTKKSTAGSSIKERAAAFEAKANAEKDKDKGMLSPSGTLKRKGSADTITSRRAAAAAAAAKKDATPAPPVPVPRKAGTKVLGDRDRNKEPLVARSAAGGKDDGSKMPHSPPGATLEIGIPCIISSKRKRFKAYARYIGEVQGEFGSWVGVEVPVDESFEEEENLMGSAVLGAPASTIAGQEGAGGGGGVGGGVVQQQGRQWNDGTWGGIRYFEIGSAGSEWDYDERADKRGARRRRLDWSGDSFGGTMTRHGGGGVKRGNAATPLSEAGREKKMRMRSVSPAVSDVSGSGGMESRGLFVRPSQVLYVVDA